MDHNHTKLFGKSLCALLLSAACCVSASAQGFNQASDNSPEWYVGIGSGLNFSGLRFSELDKALYPENKSNFSGVFSFFGECDFGPSHSFAVRPQLSFLTRGGSLHDIGRGYFANYDYPASDPGRLEDAAYQLKATYFDIRVPLIYQIGKTSWAVRPYVYVAPVLGFVTSGHIAAWQQFADGAVDGMKYELSDANMASTSFSAAFGLGAKWQFNINDAPFFLGVEVSYQLGLTDTYSSKEKDGDVSAVSFFPTVNQVFGSRKISGFEAGISFGVPFSAFRSKPAAPIIEPEHIAEPAPIFKTEAVAEVEKPCYTLDEIIYMMGQGRPVAGKTICAIDDVNFEFGKSTIMPSSHAYLKKLAETLKRTNANICVKGHTDNVGTEEFNLELSKQRALEVVKYLHQHGVDKSRLTYEYYGMSRPLTDNLTEEGRRQNRRVEFEIQK